MKNFHLNEKDNGWIITVECGSFYRELVFQSTGKALKSLAEFMRAPVVEPEEERVLDPRGAQTPNALDNLLMQGDQPIPLANPTIRVSELIEGVPEVE